jgi:hypothetical protein
MTTVEQLKSTYEKVEAAMNNVFNAQYTLDKAKNTLECDLYAATVSGDIQGSNEGARKASAHVILAEQYANVSKFEDDLALAEHVLRLVNLELSLAHDCMRVEELEAK